METSFTLEQLRDGRLKEADEILRRCVHCGFCTATCPTYLLLGDERDSPRGRIYLIKSMLEGKAAPKQIRPYLDRCLSCYSCMTTCPSGVDYMHLSDYARQIIEKSAMRAPQDKSKRKLLRNILPYPGRFRLALLLVLAARPFRRMLRRSRFALLRTVLELAPRSRLPSGEYSKAQTVKTTKSRRGRVLLLSGCVQRVLRPDLNDATVRFLNHLGYDVTLSEGEGCCGALTLHMGKEADAKAFAKKNIDAWHDQRHKGGPVNAIIVNASGCGTTVKDYGHLFAGDPAYAEKARYVSSLAKDIAEFAAAEKIDAPVGLERHPRGLSFRVLDAACAEDRRGAAPTLAQRRLHGIGDTGRAHLLRLGRELQPPSAGLGEAVEGAQARRDRNCQGRLCRDWQYRLHDAVVGRAGASGPHRRASRLGAMAGRAPSR